MREGEALADGTRRLLANRRLGRPCETTLIVCTREVCESLERGELRETDRPTERERERESVLSRL